MHINMLPERVMSSQVATVLDSRNRPAERQWRMTGHRLRRF